ncbi:MAG: iron-sulfur cluster assembly scaffold protein [bacterium]|nr:MAG: iron-sulfur cluster assembly scaffold protein [bacterium]
MSIQHEDADRLLENLRKTYLDELRSTYSPAVIQHFSTPHNQEQMDNPDAGAQYTGPCGETMNISLKIKDDRIEKVTFLTDGCGTAVACGSMVTVLATGKNLKEACEIDQEKILEELGGLPEQERHCALLAATTLHKALEDYLPNSREDDTNK